MAYTHSKYEVLMATDADLSSQADVADWAPGYVPHIIRAVSLVITNDIGSSAVVKFDKRPTSGSDSSRGDGDVATVNLDTSDDQGNAVFVDGLDVEIKPGEEVVAEVTSAASASDTAHIVLYVEPRWEQPANNTSMNDGS